MAVYFSVLVLWTGYYEDIWPAASLAVSHATAVVDGFLDNRHIEVNFRNERGQCVLWCAALSGMHERSLQCDDTQVNIADREHRLTPLGAAVVKGHKNIMQRLFKTHRVVINGQD
ncbi:ankyrin repeat protein [Aspergillus udagawae]|nr:ankyrin repeat protein [Aspergillus udagawae]